MWRRLNSVQLWAFEVVFLVSCWCWRSNKQTQTTSNWARSLDGIRSEASVCKRVSSRHPPSEDVTEMWGRRSPSCQMRFHCVSLKRYQLQTTCGGGVVLIKDFPAGYTEVFSLSASPRSLLVSSRCIYRTGRSSTIAQIMCGLRHAQKACVQEKCNHATFEFLQHELGRKMQRCQSCAS